MECQRVSIVGNGVEDWSQREGETSEKHDFSLWEQNNMASNDKVNQIAKIHHVEVPSFHVEFVSSVKNE